MIAVLALSNRAFGERRMEIDGDKLIGNEKTDFLFFAHLGMNLPVNALHVNDLFSTRFRGRVMWIKAAMYCARDVCNHEDLKTPCCIP